MKALPILDVFQYDRELWLEKHNERTLMCAEPAKKRGYEAQLTRDAGYRKKGDVGIVYEFNMCDLHRLIKQYNCYMGYKDWELPDLNKVYDFFPYAIHNGKRIVSQWHFLITRFDFIKT